MPKYLFLDLETEVDTKRTLRKQSLRNYLAVAPVMGIAWAEDAEPVDYMHATEADWPALMEYLRTLADDPSVTFVAHNAAFDIRVLRYGWTRQHGKLAIPQPSKVLCSLELSCAAWPNTPGGYSLGNLARCFGWPDKAGKATEVLRMRPEELAEYCKHDVTLCRLLTLQALELLPPAELAIATMANTARELFFEVDQKAVLNSVDTLAAEAEQHAAAIAEALATDEATGIDSSGRVKSIKPAKVKAALLQALGFCTETITRKKINQTALAQNPAAGQVLEQVERANKALATKRRLTPFLSTTEVDAELGYFRAHTGRFSSPSVGKGLGLHNLAKHNKVVAKALRSLFRLPQEVCFVRGDLANVEYRIAGLLCQSKHVVSLFANNCWADPYAAFWQSATGQQITKKDPARQVAKVAVLGLSYGMGTKTWVNTLATAVANPTNHLSLAMLGEIAEAQGWPRYVSGKYLTAIARATQADPVLISVADRVREAFHVVHPEFSATANWLVRAASRISLARGAAAANQTIAELYDEADAPQKQYIALEYPERFEAPTLRVTCGQWSYPTVTWRALGIRAGKDGYGVGLHFMAGGNKGWRCLSPSQAIENVVQSAARNALCAAQLRLADRYPYMLSVHDELLLVVPRDTASVQRARLDLLATFAPDTPYWLWSAVMHPEEIAVSQSLYEDQQSMEWWHNLSDKDLERLP